MSPTPPNPYRMHLLIAGYGSLGRELGSRAAARGHRVTALRRGRGALPAGIGGLTADLRELRKGDLSGTYDAAVFCAAPDARTPEAYRATYVDGLARLLAALAHGSGQRVLFTGSTAVYGQSDGSWVDEDSDTEPESFTGATLLEAERALRAGASAGCCLRLGGLYGPGRTRRIDAIAHGTASVHAGGPAWTNRIHRSDAAGAILHLLEAAEPPPAVLNLVDAQPAPRAEVDDFIAARLGLGPVRREDAAPPSAGKRVSSRRLAELGYAFEYPTYREGYGAQLDALASRQDGRP